MKLTFQKWSDVCTCIYNGERYCGDICFLVDSGWVYYPDDDNSGYFTAEFMQAIADKLDELNAELFRDFPQETVSPN